MYALLNPLVALQYFSKKSQNGKKNRLKFKQGKRGDWILSAISGICNLHNSSAVQVAFSPLLKQLCCKLGFNLFVFESGKAKFGCF